MNRNSCAFSIYPTRLYVPCEIHPLVIFSPLIIFMINYKLSYYTNLRVAIFQAVYFFRRHTVKIYLTYVYEYEQNIQSPGVRSSDCEVVVIRLFAVLRETQIFWDFTPCRSLNSHPRLKVHNVFIFRVSSPCVCLLVPSLTVVTL